MKTIVANVVEQTLLLKYSYIDLLSCVLNVIKMSEKNIRFFYLFFSNAQLVFTLPDYFN